MNLIEWLLVILAGATVATTIIQCIEMWILVRNQRETNNILQNPGTIIANLILQLQDDDEFREVFWGLVQGVGLKAYEGVTAFTTQVPAAVKEQAYKNLPKPLKGIMKAADALGIDIPGLIKQKAKDTAKKTVDEWGG